MAGEHNPLPRVLVVEDNFLTANSIKLQLVRLGCEVVGPTPSLAQALELARREWLDGAVLDVNVGGRPSTEVALVLQQRACPFFFIAGYASPPLPDGQFGDVLKLRKPIDPKAFAAAVDIFRSKPNGNPHPHSGASRRPCEGC
jgi:CheY-like chemotaxis protein